MSFNFVAVSIQTNLASSLVVLTSEFETVNDSEYFQVNGNPINVGLFAKPTLFVHTNAASRAENGVQALRALSRVHV